MPPLLFIHGASCDARVWQFGFLAEFTRRGFRCHAINLPGHGVQPLPTDFSRLGIDDYARAVDRAVAACAEPPILVGHSLGGYLAQKHVLAGRPAQGLVLLASAPPQGMAREVLSFLFHHPLLALRLDLAGGRGRLAARRARVRGMLLTAQTPDSVVDTVAGLLQPESPLAFRQLATQTLAARPVPVPVLVLAGGQDRLISVAASRAMAQRYGVHAHVYPDMAHMLPLEPGWQGVSADILDFLAAHFPAAASGTTEEQVGAA